MDDIFAFPNQSSVKQYIDYLKRLNRTSDKSMLEQHLEIIPKEIALEYGISEDEYNKITIYLKEGNTI